MLIEDGFNEVLNHLSMRILINIAPPNNSMKKTIVFLWCYVFLCSLVLHAQSPDTPTHLVIHQNNGNSISILLRDKPKITFPYDDKNKLQITSLNGVYEFGCSNLKNIYYISEISGVKDNVAVDDNVETQGDKLCFYTSKPNAHISIVDVKGNIIMSEKIDSGCFYYPLSNLLSGTYIAKINDTTIKFIKR